MAKKKINKSILFLNGLVFSPAWSSPPYLPGPRKEALLRHAFHRVTYWLRHLPHFPVLYIQGPTPTPVTGQSCSNYIIPALWAPMSYSQCFHFSWAFPPAPRCFPWEWWGFHSWLGVKQNKTKQNKTKQNKNQIPPKCKAWLSAVSGRFSHHPTASLYRKLHPVWPPCPWDICYAVFYSWLSFQLTLWKVNFHPVLCERSMTSDGFHILFALLLFMHRVCAAPTPVNVMV